jgi:hypothetical protein
MTHHTWINTAIFKEIKTRADGTCQKSQLLRGQRVGVWWFKAIPLQKEYSRIFGHVFNSIYKGGIGRRIMVQGRPLSKK